MHHHTSRFSVFFGNRTNGLEAPSVRGTDEEERSCISTVTDRISHNIIYHGLQSFPGECLPLSLPIILLQQMHGIISHTLESCINYPAFALRSLQGDALITTVPQTAIGVLTADCLPIIVYNNQSHTLANIHAGWRGIIQGIIGKTLAKISTPYTDYARDYTIVLGPSARGCCYQVGREFGQNIPKTHIHSLQERNSDMYFDLHTYALQDLALHNIPLSAIERTPLCTICDTRFYSYRREGPLLAQRQMHIAILHKKS
jgi:YfiH family protein